MRSSLYMCEAIPCISALVRFSTSRISYVTPYRRVHTSITHTQCRFKRLSTFSSLVTCSGTAASLGSEAHAVVTPLNLPAVLRLTSSASVEVCRHRSNILTLGPNLAHSLSDDSHMMFHPSACPSSSITTVRLINHLLRYLGITRHDIPHGVRDRTGYSVIGG